jgi:dienelactone hydrolase
MRSLFLALVIVMGASAQPVVQMIDGINRYLERATSEQISKRTPLRVTLRKILGVVDPRVPFADLNPVLLEPGVYAVRWPVLDGVTAEGLWFKPHGTVRCRVVTIPDADQLPENFRVSQLLAAAGCEVLSPVLINREHTWSGNPAIQKMTLQPHREFIYRMAFEVGRTLPGYETQKVLAAVDWFAAQTPSAPLSVWGYGEGGAIALYAAALDDRITVAGISGYFAPREGLWTQPIDRNVFGLLKDFGDAELAGMVSPRALVIDTTAGPVWHAQKGATPGDLTPESSANIEREVRRAGGATLTGDGVQAFLQALRTDLREAKLFDLRPHDADARQHRQFDELVQYTQKLARNSHFLREALWAGPDSAPANRARLWNDVIGRLPASHIPLNVRQKQAYQGPEWTGYDVTYDVLPDVIGYGVLLVPKDIKPGERRPVIVAQHGLNGYPQDMFGQPENDLDGKKYTSFHFYQNIGSKLATRGYVVYLPQNPYTGEFREIQRRANPLGLSIFSFILAQNERLLDWLATLPYVDASHIGFYGLSYGGKTALRVPALLDRYAFSICSGDFNEWVHKVTTIEDANSYMFNGEYEMPEFDLASVANHAEMAMMIAPRPFMVERGHRDGVGLDEWVAFEYAKVKRYYDEQGIGDRTEIEYFNGPHMIHGVGTLEFIHKWFGR